MSIIINELKSIVGIYFALLVVAIGMFSFFVDKEGYKRACFYKEEKTSKFIGLAYVVIGPALFIILEIL